MASNLREGPAEINAAAAVAVQASSLCTALDSIRPGLLADGGNLELLAIEDDGTVRLELQGACESCPSQAMTVRFVIEPYLKRKVRGVTGVIVG